ncbi:Endoplasmin [Temnothorax longispinosus]|uniref:Heat shock protein 83 n=2 Tax=Temnothorax longispinosus TaxID=300112 RepID=A0A4S2JRH4_9HYME|nr:Endoplasmin [Temnothorax longispinosus]
MYFSRHDVPFSIPSARRARTDNLISDYHTSTYVALTYDLRSRVRFRYSGTPDSPDPDTPVSSWSSSAEAGRVIPILHAAATMRKLYLLIAGLFLLAGFVRAEDELEENTVEDDLGASREASRTDHEAVQREEEAIKIDGLNPAQIKELREKAEKFAFQTEVNRMMKLIINSLYRNKEIYLRELISNASDALDKIRLLSLTDKSVLETNSELAIRIKADKENKVLHIMDSGIGMTKQDLVNNLGTIAKSGTAEFLGKMQEVTSTQDMNDMIGQFGVGFYSAYLVANVVVVTTKHNKDKQYIWESDSSNYSIVEDPRGDTLKRGTTVSLHLKEEAVDFLEPDTIKNLVKKYSQFINFPIYLWNSKVVQVDADEVEEDKPVKKDAEKDDTEDKEDEEDDTKVEEDADEKKPKKVDKTVWDWELLNDSKPIWTLKPNEVDQQEYIEFYKTLTKDTQEPLAKTHFVAEGEVTFKSVLFIPKVQPTDSFNRYGTKSDNIKLYVRRVFITDKFTDMMPNYLSFIRGIVDSDDLPLNVSRENLQQHKLIKIIKKKLIRKVLDMIKKMPKEDYQQFWKEFSTNIKLGIIEDAQNRARLSKMLQFHSSAQTEMTSLPEYVARMKPTQQHIYYIAGSSEEEVKKSPFVERLEKKGYEVLYLTEAVDEYAISSLPEFDGKKFQNVAKEGFTLDEGERAKERMEQVKTTFEPLVKWLNDILKDHISKAQVSERLTDSPCALVASMYGWTGNMERLAISNAHQKTDDPQKSYYLNQKKILEINPRHPLVRELLRRVEVDSADQTAKDITLMMFRTATLRSGYMLRETASFADSVEQLMRRSLGISLDEVPEEEDAQDDESASSEKVSDVTAEDEKQEEEEEDEEHKNHEEL